ncbi:MAG: hypothetical protein OEP48_03220 [Betaproteobacteria bacterium]|nr:hypothetical protein [Betaproteobacteria bacterium]MDH3436276.1 hypothetical protein [Betaproteobacteria bacterium]
MGNVTGGANAEGEEEVGQEEIEENEETDKNAAGEAQSKKTPGHTQAGPQEGGAAQESSTAQKDCKAQGSSTAQKDCAAQNGSSNPCGSAAGGGSGSLALPDGQPALARWRR